MPRITRRVLLLFCLFPLLSGVYSQTDVMPVYYSARDTGNGMVVDLENLNFFSNNEYNSDLLPGYTLMGTWINGSLKYRPSDVLSLEGGVQLRRFFGADSSAVTSPFFLRLKFNPIRDLTIIFGELDHQHYWTMPQQMMDIERLYTNSREEGLQIKYAGNRYFNGEAWIDWERMIFKGSAFREQFTAGFTGKILLLNRNSYQVTIPLNYTAKHWGGEIDVSPNFAATLTNTGSGLYVLKQISGCSLRDIGASFQYFTYSGSSHATFTPFAEGSAFYPKLFANFKRSSVSFAYWNSKSYASFHGDPFYSNFLNGVNYPERSIIDASYQWNYLWSDIFLFSFRTRFYYDVQNQNLDLRAGIILHLKKSFRLRTYN